MHRPPATRSSSIAVACAAVLLGGCGVGVALDIIYDDPPSVSISASTAAAAAGAGLTLNAQADDDDRVVEVDFFRLDPNGRNVRLCVDASASYDCATTIPAGAAHGSSIGFFARAYDSFGQRTDSAPVTVTVL